MTINLDPLMHNIARAAILNVLHHDLLEMERVFRKVGPDLTQAELAAMEDYRKAAQRLAVSLNAEDIP